MVKNASYAVLTLVWEVRAWGIFLLIAENKRLEEEWLEAIWHLWDAFIPAIYLCFSCSGNCHTDGLLSLCSLLLGSGVMPYCS